MLRFYFIICISIPLIIYYIVMANYYCSHPSKYDEKARYNLALSVIKSVQLRGQIKTVVIDKDNLPKSGGYIMYSNHQGKYDALGIMVAHETPCSVVIDKSKSRTPLLNHVINLVDGKRLDRNDYHQQLGEIHSLIEEVKEGRRYIYFPEGGYNHNENELQEFHAGAFKCALKAKTTIVPVAIYDSYLPFDYNSLRPVTTQVCFLEPIYYEDYSSMTSKGLSNLVKSRIEDKMVELEENRKRNGYNKKLLRKIEKQKMAAS